MTYEHNLNKLREPATPSGQKHANIRSVDSAAREAWFSRLEAETKPVQLSRSRIWELQKQYYKHAGVEAWSPNAVPNYATSNSFIAYNYAAVIKTFFEEFMAGGTHRPGQPLYIVEIGTGIGRFSFHILQHLFSNMSLSKDILSKIIYVMTDISDSNIEFWRSHPQFQSFIDNGQLDFANFDFCQDSQIKLLNSETTIAANNHDNPVAYIANYVFDSIPHDFFAIRGGELHERLVSYEFQGQPQSVSDIVKMTTFSYEEQKCDTNYYKDGNRNKILEAYASKHDDFNFSLPTGSFDGIDNLQKLSAGPHLLISADFGDISEQEIAQLSDRKLARNGIHSVKVNYDAVRKYAAHKGCLFYANERSNNALAISGILGKGNSPHDFARTGQAFHEYICDFGPDDFFTIKKIVESEYDRLSVEQVVALMQLSKWDHRFFKGCEDALNRAIPSLSQSEKNTLADVLEKTFKMHFVQNEHQDISPSICRILEKMDYRDRAARLRQQHQRLFG